MSELTPYLCVADARAALAWYVEVLGAVVSFDPIVMDDGRIGHAELTRDGATWMVSDVFEGCTSPRPRRAPAARCRCT